MEPKQEKEKKTRNYYHDYKKTGQVKKSGQQKPESQRGSSAVALIKEGRPSPFWRKKHEGAFRKNSQKNKNTRRKKGFSRSMQGNASQEKNKRSGTARGGTGKEKGYYHGRGVNNFNKTRAVL